MKIISFLLVLCFIHATLCASNDKDAPAETKTYLGDLKTATDAYLAKLAVKMKAQKGTDVLELAMLKISTKHCNITHWISSKVQQDGNFMSHYFEFLGYYNRIAAMLRKTGISIEELYLHTFGEIVASVLNKFNSLYASFGVTASTFTNSIAPADLVTGQTTAVSAADKLTINDFLVKMYLKLTYIVAVDTDKTEAMHCAEKVYNEQGIIPRAKAFLSTVKEHIASAFSDPAFSADTITYFDYIELRLRMIFHNYRFVKKTKNYNLFLGFADAIANALYKSINAMAIEANKKT